MKILKDKRFYKFLIPDGYIRPEDVLYDNNGNLVVTSSANNEIKVRVDINGDRDPNFNTFPMTAESCSDGENIFCINVRFDGKISVEEDSIEAEMLRSQTIKKEERQNNN